MSSRGSSSSASSGNKQRRRSRPRSDNLLNIDVAEARRQVCHALLLHRKAAANSSFPSSSSSSSSSSLHEVANGTTSTQLMQSMPQPEPVWSTTAPSVMRHISHTSYFGGAAAMEAAAADIEFEWGENDQASAYAWWMAFLKSLDGDNSTTSNATTVVHQELKYYPFALGSNSNWFLGDNFKVEEADDHDQQIPSPDEWLVIPTTENHEGEFNHVIS